MKIVGTARSHFTRKVRILLDAYNLDYDFEDVGNVADATAFAENPLMKVPTFFYEGQWLIESDHIAAFLTRKFMANDPYQVLTNDPTLLNFRAVINGIMAQEVEILLAERTGIDTHHVRFQKMRKSIALALSWLEKEHSYFPKDPSYCGFHLVCMWDHLKLYKTTELAFPQIEELVQTLSEIHFVAKSQPK